MYYNPHLERVIIYRGAYDLVRAPLRAIPHGDPRRCDYEALDLCDAVELMNAPVCVDTQNGLYGDVPSGCGGNTCIDDDIVIGDTNKGGDSIKIRWCITILVTRKMRSLLIIWL